MSLKSVALTMGIGAAVGAVAIMMTPKQCAARTLANKAADKVESAADQVTSKLNQKLQ